MIPVSPNQSVGAARWGSTSMKITFAFVRHPDDFPAIAAGQEVSVNYNHGQDFSQYHTYAWGSNNANNIKIQSWRRKPGRY